MEANTGGRVIPPSPLRWLRRLAVAAVVLTAVGIGTIALIPAVRDCAAGVHHQGGECIGVTDGSFVYSTATAGVEQAIAAENAWVDQQSATHVSIVFLEPMTFTNANGPSPTQLREHLEGAFVAVFNANHPSGTARSDDGKRPLIRLLLANSGATGDGWETAVQEIEHRLGAPDHVVAVAGLGYSLETTRKAIARLSADKIPMFGALITADDLSDIRGLVRVAPTNSREVEAGMDFMTRTIQPRRVVLIQDMNSSDHYAATLAQQFDRNSGSGRFVVLPPEAFDSSLKGADNAFRAITANICIKAPDLIFYAGRAGDLRSLVLALGMRACGDRRLTILTGDDASGLDATLLGPSLRNGISVFYTNLAHPDDWQQHGTPTSTRFAQLMDRLFHGASLTDGDAIMTHDAVLTAVVAIRDVAGQSQEPPPPEEIINIQLAGLNGVNAVQGASGLISIDVHGNPGAEDGTGRPIPKTVVVIELSPNGQTALPTFVGRSPA